MFELHEQLMITYTYVWCNNYNATQETHQDKS